MNCFQFVDDHRDAFEVKRLCQVLGLNRSSYYKWRTRGDARQAREQDDRLLAETIRLIHADSRGTNGSPRVTAELRDHGLRVNEKKVARVMRKFSIVGIRLRRRIRTTVSESTSTDAVQKAGVRVRR
ncbi:IS3 family transposase [Streptomyces sp. NPDC048496]|uniref:IS3 family transposase n=1 Tax=Streptomyces sp. NPDC048496 TaxID=3365558 RepID=UPI003713C872